MTDRDNIWKSSGSKRSLFQFEGCRFNNCELNGRSITPVRSKQCTAFTLVEVVLAMGLMVFGVMVVIGLLSIVLETNRESRNQMGAANAASSIIAARRAAPTNSSVNVFLPVINQEWDSTKGEGYITSDGAVTANASTAAFYATYQAGINAATGDRAGNIDIELFWPPAAKTNARSHYEVFTTVSW